MKYLNQLILVLIICMVGFSGLQAQDNSEQDLKRIAGIQQDIEILEAALQEILKTEWNTENTSGTLTSVKIHRNGLNWASNASNNVRGSYFAGYGALFIATDSKPVVLNVSGSKKPKGIFSNAVNGKSGTDKISRESIIERISEFLMDYGSTIKQLRPDDKVSVVYKANNIDQLLTIIGENSVDNQVETNSIPSLSVSATMNNLRAYRKRQINKSSFLESLTIQNIDSKDESERRLRIMSKILQTSFDDDQSDNFEISDVTHTYLNDFGVIFESKASYGSGLFGFMNASFSKLRDKLKKMAEVDSLKISINNDTNSWSSEDDTEDVSPQEIKQAYNNFISMLKETLVDYGHTLSSVQADEHIVISLSLPATRDITPKSVDLQIKKSVLENLDKGNLSREEAIEEINILAIYKYGKQKDSNKISPVSFQN